MFAMRKADEPGAEPERAWRSGFVRNVTSLGTIPAGLAWPLFA